MPSCPTSAAAASQPWSGAERRGGQRGRAAPRQRGGDVGDLAARDPHGHQAAGGGGHAAVLLAEEDGPGVAAGEPLSVDDLQPVDLGGAQSEGGGVVAQPVAGAGDGVAGGGAAHGAERAVGREDRGRACRGRSTAAVTAPSASTAARWPADGVTCPRRSMSPQGRDRVAEGADDVVDGGGRDRPGVGGELAEGRHQGEGQQAGSGHGQAAANRAARAHVRDNAANRVVVTRQ